MAKWTHVIEVKFEMELVDGTRVGGAGGGLEIGGVDANLMALKDPRSAEPYIPGSSLKGKLRSILEKEYDLAKGSEPCNCGEPTCRVCPVFGAHKNTRPKCGAARLIVRDAYFTPAYRQEWIQNPVYEIKAESINDRRSGAAGSPRFQERVPRGAIFQVEMPLKVFQGDNSDSAVKDLKHALTVLERFDALGAGGSRGSGRIKVHNPSADRIALSDL